MADSLNSQEPGSLSRRALQTRALAAARGTEGAERLGLGPEQPASVRWHFDPRLGWLVIGVVSALLLATILWALAGQPRATVVDNQQLGANPIADRAPGTEAVPSDDAVASADGLPSDPAEADRPLLVHVAGEVNEPGVVELPAGSRVSDAVSAAGGVTEVADLTRINLAAWVADGERIYLLSKTEEAAPQLVTGSVGGGTGGGGADAERGSELINLNTADASQLQTLSGIGPAMAQRIIEHREQFGAFTSLADLDAVSGIGPAMLSRLETKVTW